MATPEAKTLLQAWEKQKTAQSLYANSWSDAEAFCLPEEALRQGKQLTDTSGFKGARNLAAAIYANTYTPGRPWFQNQASEKKDEIDFVRKWLSQLTEVCLRYIGGSNFSEAFYDAVLNACVSGNGCTFVGYDRGRRQLYFLPYRCPQVTFSYDSRGNLESFYRAMSLTPAQAVAEFPEAPADVTWRDRYAKDPLCADKFAFVHAVVARTGRDATKLDDKNTPWASYYIDVEKQAIVKESGYSSFPYAVFRFYASGSDYGVGPGVSALPVLRNLNVSRSDLTQLIELKMLPPVFVPGGMQYKVILKPGAVIPYDPSQGQPAFLNVQGDVSAGVMDYQQLKADCNDEFYGPLLYQMQALESGKTTAREVDERSDEKIQALAPVVTRLHSQYLDGVLTRVVELMVSEGLVEPPPAELLEHNGQKTPLQVSIQYQSRLQARLNQVQNQDVLAAVTDIAALNATAAQVPTIHEIVDIRKASREIAWGRHLPVDVMVTEEDGKKIRAQREQALQQQQEAEAAMKMARPMDLQRAAEPGSPVAQLTGAANGGTAPVIR